MVGKCVAGRECVLSNPVPEVGVSVRAHTGPADFNDGGKGHPPMRPSNPVRGKMTIFDPGNKDLLPIK